jgi:hypothetical protein
MAGLRVLYPVVIGAGAIAVGGALFLLRGRGKTEAQLETERRDRLSAKGRLCDGTVIDVQEMNSEVEIPTQLLIYQYDVAGVQYECSQDVTWLRQFVDFHSCRLGLPASIKYDPQNPGNSIVISEGWSGLRR